MTCTFFGNRNITDDIQPKLQKILEELIENNNTDKFYVGNHGRFDAVVLKTLRNLKKIYPHIQYNVVLAYIPTEKKMIMISPKLFIRTLLKMYLQNLL